MNINEKAKVLRARLKTLASTENPYPTSYTSRVSRELNLNGYPQATVYDLILGLLQVGELDQPVRMLNNDDSLILTKHPLDQYINIGNPEYDPYEFKESDDDEDDDDDCCGCDCCDCGQATASGPVPMMVGVHMPMTEILRQYREYQNQQNQSDEKTDDTEDSSEADESKVVEPSEPADNCPDENKGGCDEVPASDTEQAAE